MMTVRSLKIAAGLPLACLLLATLVGCGGKQQSSDIGKPGETQQESVSRRLNDPHVSEAEKQQIKQHMGQSGASGGAK